MRTGLGRWHSRLAALLCLAAASTARGGDPLEDVDGVEGWVEPRAASRSPVRRLRLVEFPEEEDRVEGSQLIARERAEFDRDRVAHEAAVRRVAQDAAKLAAENAFASTLWEDDARRAKKQKKRRKPRGKQLQADGIPETPPPPEPPPSALPPETAAPMPPAIADSTTAPAPEALEPASGPQPTPEPVAESEALSEAAAEPLPPPPPKPWTSNFGLRYDFEVGHQSALRLEGPEFTRNHTYGYAHGELEIRGSGLSLAAALRGWADPEGYEIDPRSLALKFKKGPLVAVLGLQEIAWGETFGQPIADLVNPRDLRDPFILDMDWVRVPVVAANLKLVFGGLRLQGIATPYPASNVLPDPKSEFSFFPSWIANDVPIKSQRTFPLERWGQDGEYGGRLSFLFPGGVDVSAFYLWHWNRRPAYVVVPDGFGNGMLAPVAERSHSFGLSFSVALDQLVIRGDSVVHLDEPWQSPNLVGQVDRILHVQAVVGADYTTESAWVFGLQYHYDRRWEDNLHWLSARVAFSFFNGALEPEVFFFTSLGEGDRWLQPKLTWNITDGWAVSLDADLVWGTSSSDLGPFDGKHRLFGQLKYRF